MQKYSSYFITMTHIYGDYWDIDVGQGIQYL